MKIVRTAVAEIGYLESGQSDGFPVLFLHGFPDDAHTWDRVVDELEGLPLRLIRPFQRGFGPSQVTAIAAHSGQVAALAQDVLDLADALGIARFTLVGQDWGRRAAHAVAVLAPERVTGLLVLATVMEVSLTIRTCGYVKPRCFGINGGFIPRPAGRLSNRIGKKFVNICGESGRRSGGLVQRSSLRLYRASGTSNSWIR
jgi:pimeloyl-ACP methyl ester carboxylesterase